MTVKGSDMVFTAYRLKLGGGAYPWTQTGVISHRRDLADVGEPYLSAIKENGSDLPNHDAYVQWSKQND